MDAELLEHIAFADGDHADAIARNAFGEFYQRHVTWLYRRLCRPCAFGRLNSMDAVKDVVQDTLYSDYKGAPTFDPKRLTDPRRLEGLVRGWLGGIANRVIADMLRHSEPDVMEPARLESRRAVWPNANPESASESPVVKALQEELEKLSPLQKDILATAELYYKPDTTYQRLPNGVAIELAEKHGTSLDNIRQVRRRTLANLREKIQPLLEEE